MISIRNHITAIEHQSIRLGQVFRHGKFDEDILEACQRFYGQKGVPYFDLIHNGLRFKEFVGVIQVGSTLIEVLPKADKENLTQQVEDKWRRVLIGMLKAVHGFDVQSPTSSSLNLKANTLLDLYFKMFVSEVEYLLHTGLAKKYRKQDNNAKALKGSLLFGKQLQHNLVHQERFFVKHTVYDVNHTLHFILYKTLRVLKTINTNSALHSKIGALLLYFPEMPDIKISEQLFDRIHFDRKTKAYQKAIEIAKMILLRYHPDLSKGRNHVLALMFDMNDLWEKFVLASLKKHLGLQVSSQNTKNFWKPLDGPRRTVRPDILIKTGEDSIVFDTKWKLLTDNRPSVEDIRQMYTYHQYFKADKVALIFPGDLPTISGKFADIEHPNSDSDLECSLMFIPVGFDVKQWQVEIAERVGGWILQ